MKNKNIFLDQTHFSKEVSNQKLSRRSFLWLSGASAVSMTGLLTSCAVNPVTGERQIMMVSEAEEIAMDQGAAPRQFANDYGAVQEKSINHYVAQLGSEIAAQSHRTHMPYNFRAVNANYVNAYAFPGGSIAVTRGILVNLKNEAELSALLGHEVGHVNARHTAERMSKGNLYGIVMAGATGLMDVAGYGAYKPAAEMAGNLGGTVLLASYSRGDERQADALGMEYMTKASQNPNGMTGLMELLISLNKNKPSSIEAMFSSHPMSTERYQTAKLRAQNEVYGVFSKRNLNRDRYMDNLSSLFRIKGAIDAQQKGQAYLNKTDFNNAEAEFLRALKLAPNDYTGLLLMAQSKMSQEKYQEAEPYLLKARNVYKSEAKAMQLSGINFISSKKPEQALSEFKKYERALPLDSLAIFFQGLSHEGMNNRPDAVNEYKRFLQKQNQGEQAQYAYSRLKEWGEI